MWPYDGARACPLLDGVCLRRTGVFLFALLRHGACKLLRAEDDKPFGLRLPTTMRLPSMFQDGTDAGQALEVRVCVRLPKAGLVMP